MATKAAPKRSKVALSETQTAPNALIPTAPVPPSHQPLLTELAGLRGNSWLLTGPQRVGKRSLALHAAQIQNCLHPSSNHAPCMECPSCRAALVGAHPDIMLIVPRTQTSTGKAARRKVIPVGAVVASRDTAHDYEQHVYEFLEVRPTYKRRVVIIDGAEYLNEQAANALLKLIEEPPHQALFVLLAEDVRAVLPTLVSRSGQLRAVPISDAELAELSPAPLEREVSSFLAGRAGFLSELEQVTAALASAHDLTHAAQESLWATLEKASTLEQSFDAALSAEALRFVWRDLSPQQRTKLDDALSRLSEALEAYANPALSMQVFMLSVRAALLG